MDEVIPLFREFHIAQIKDYQLELHNDLIKTNEASFPKEFTEQL